MSDIENRDWSKYNEYYIGNASDELAAINMSLDSVKTRIVRNTYTKMHRADRVTQRKFEDFGYDADTAAKLVTGELLSDALRSYGRPQPIHNPVTRADIEYIMGAANSNNLLNISNKIDTEIDECLNTINRYLGHKGLNKQIVNDIVTDIIYNQKSLKNMTGVTKDVWQSLANHTERNKIFRYSRAKTANVRQDLTRIISVLGLLAKAPLGNTGTETVTVTHGKRSYQPKAKEETKKIEDMIVDLLHKWRINLDAEMFETANIGAALMLHNKVGYLAGNLIWTTSSPNKNDYFDVSVTYDPKLKQMYEKTGIMLQDYQKTKDDGYIHFWQSKTGIELTYTITAKEMKSSLVIDPSNLNIIQSGHFYSVKDSPLSSIIARDAGLNSNFLENFRLVSTIVVPSNRHSWEQNPQYNSTININGMFNKYVDIIKTAALYKTLVGVNKYNNDDDMMIMRVGPSQFTSASKVLTSVFTNDGTVKTTMHPTLDRSVTESLNINLWKGNTPDFDSAWARSDELPTAFNQYLHTTKMSIKFTFNGYKIF